MDPEYPPEEPGVFSKSPEEQLTTRTAPRKGRLHSATARMDPVTQRGKKVLGLK